VIDLFMITIVSLRLASQLAALPEPQ
jgi:hypothetical protein